MIDCHCHLDQKEYSSKIDFLISKWRKELKFVVSSCIDVKKLDLAIELYEKYFPFVKLSVGLHPAFIKEIHDTDVTQMFDFITKNKDKIVAIGEVGLDYHWIKEKEWQEKQKSLFLKFIELSKEINKPLIIHSWESTQDAITILEQENMENRKILFHLLQDRSVLAKIIENNWFLSVGPAVLKSKNIKKIVRDAPLNKILLETDSPWFPQSGQEFGEPTNVKIVCEKIAEIKKLSFEEIERQTDSNAEVFFNLREL